MFQDHPHSLNRVKLWGSSEIGQQNENKQANPTQKHKTEKKISKQINQNPSPI